MTTVIDGTSGITFPAGGTGNPAGTVVGTTDTQTLTNKTINGSQLVAASVASTQLATAVQPIGVGQTWQQFSSPARVLDTTYTNSTGRPIMVSVSANSGTTSYYEVQIGGLAVTRFSTSTTYGATGCATFIVPDNTTYRVASVSGGAALNLWAELR